MRKGLISPPCLAFLMLALASSAALAWVPVDPDLMRSDCLIEVQARGGRSSSTPRASIRRPLSAKEMATSTSERVGRNRVSVPTSPTTTIHYDLAGRSHFDKTAKREIDTPHKKTTTTHIGPNGKTNVTHSPVESMSKSDVRTVNRALRNRNP
jgi:hypothetical protein